MFALQFSSQISSSPLPVLRLWSIYLGLQMCRYTEQSAGWCPIIRLPHNREAWSQAMKSLETSGYVKNALRQWLILGTETASPVGAMSYLHPSTHLLLHLEGRSEATTHHQPLVIIKERGLCYRG